MLRADPVCYTAISGPPRSYSRGNMEQHVRAASAAIAFAHALDREVLSVYEHEGRRYSRIRVRVTGDIANGCDFDNGCHIASALPSIYHFGAKSYCLLRPKRHDSTAALTIAPQPVSQ